MTRPEFRPDLEFRLLDGPHTAEYEQDLATLHAEIYADPPYQFFDDVEQFVARFRVERRQPGFVLAGAWHGGYLVGYATGLPLRPSTSWWRNLTTAVPDDVTEEHAGRTFALTELAVRASWRRQGIGRSLYDLVVGGRPEERATLAVLPAATPAQQAFRQWGWRKAARSRDPRPGPPAPGAFVYDILVRTLRSA
ncbi:MAG TPA: GNAT family N-acetyltransferase [Streptosporangiaceae bacterium]|nr:GNAT family N-acetyltransferase [Streptosporangiaceae bacterium]